jgi:hypothetical protein
VRSSEYFRAQARLYRDIAHLMTDRQSSSHALDAATEYLKKAQEMELAERDAQRFVDRSRERSRAPWVRIAAGAAWRRSIP